MRTLINISYDGTNYCGWQLQRGQTTVQSVIESAVSKLYGKQVKILGASRTDSGVHAYGQRATFTPPDNRLPVERLHLALNAMLPSDIRIIGAQKVPESFHVINDVISKTYVYKIQNSYVHNPLQYRFSHHIKEALNFTAMEEGAKYFIGEKDFKGFCAAHSGASTTVRTVYRLALAKEGEIISMEISGSGFLYNMVRIIAGTLVEVGMGRIEPGELSDIIASGRRERAGRTLPAKGLFLVDIEYSI